jgi:NitT/TauT family transport system substrate-binding protein
VFKLRLVSRLISSTAVILTVSIFAGNTRAAEPVSLITDFGYNGRHAYFFVALDKGYYSAADLDVKILRGQGSVDAIRQTGNNNATFGFADAGSLVLARGNDKIPVKLAAIVYAKPPQGIFCRGDSSIKKPKDLEGVSIANPPGGATVDMFPIYAKAEGVDASKVNWVVASSESLPSLLATNKVPCVGQFVVGEPLLQKQVGSAKLVRFAYMDAGLNFYGNGIVTTDGTFAAKPDLVKRFVAATIHGMRDAFANPEEAGNILHKYHPEIAVDVAIGETKAVAELAEVPGQPLGMIDPARVNSTIDVVKSVFKLNAPVSANDIYVPGFVSK